MKKHRFIKNKVMEHIVKVSIEKATLIFHTHVRHGIDDSNEVGHAWMVWSQHHTNMTYRSQFLSPSVFVAHMNGCCVETCVNIKLSFFLHVLITLKKISFNIVRHDMDIIVEVLLPCLWTLPICTFVTVNLMMKRPMKIILKSHGVVTCSVMTYGVVRV